MRKTLKGIAELNYDNGIIVDVKIGKQIGNYPLVDLRAIDTNSHLHTIIEDYQEWLEDYNMDNEDGDDFFF